MRWARAATDASALPVAYTNHKAMLNRGVDGHPRDLAIPEKASRAVHRADGTEIAASYTDYWTDAYVLEETVSSIPNLYFWSGMGPTGAWTSRGNTNCDHWENGGIGRAGYAGAASLTDNRRFVEPGPRCNTTRALLWGRLKRKPLFRQESSFVSKTRKI